MNRAVAKMLTGLVLLAMMLTLSQCNSYGGKNPSDGPPPSTNRALR